VRRIYRGLLTVNTLISLPAPLLEEQLFDAEDEELQEDQNQEWSAVVIRETIAYVWRRLFWLITM